MGSFCHFKLFNLLIPRGKKKRTIMPFIVGEDGIERKYSCQTCIKVEIRTVFFGCSVFFLTIRIILFFSNIRVIDPRNVLIIIDSYLKLNQKVDLLVNVKLVANFESLKEFM